MPALAPLLLLLACNREAAAPPRVEIPLLTARGDQAPAAIARELELQAVKTYVDLFDLGSLYLAEGRYPEAAEAYEMAARNAPDARATAGALYGKASALGYAGRMDLALEASDAMVRLAPDNQEAAYLRYALYRHSGDAFGLHLATDHLLRVDPSAGGEAVMDPVTGMVVIAGMVVVASAGTAVTVVALTPPEERAEVAVQVFSGYAGIVEGVGVAAIGGLGPSLGRALVASR